MSTTGRGGAPNITGTGGTGGEHHGRGRVVEHRRARAERRVRRAPAAGGMIMTGTAENKKTSTSSGCSCSTVEPSRGPLAFVVLLLLALVLRRRKIL